MTDGDIVNGLKKGKTKALEQLIDRYGAYVSSVISRILRGRNEDCRELSADVFLAVWENREKLRAENLKGYLGAAARNKAFNKLRNEREELPLEEDMIIFDEGEQPCEAVERKETALLVNRAVNDLEPITKELFLRHYYYGQSVAEAADALGLSLSAAKTRLCRGRQTLKEILLKEGYDYGEQNCENK